ncbi:hypothetical protein, partial [Phocaeicola plebeius]|uniref:hypothetical protein n=1 Tax=Phocaeicola plebeius TaxID=310297 RepID=UPI003A909022
AVLTEVLRQKRFRTFFVCTPASVSAAGRFFFLLPDSFFPSFSPCYPFFPCRHPDGLQKCAWRRFLRKGESFFTGTFRYA